VGSKATLLRHLASSLPSVKFPERMRPSPAPRRGAQSQPRRKPPPKGQSQGVKGSSSGILFGAQVHPGVCFVLGARNFLIWPPLSKSGRDFLTKRPSQNRARCSTNAKQLLGA
jgi:hypothetical protein